MPLYEGLVLGSDKYCAIFEFGTSHTKCGFAFEYAPRVFVKSEIYLKRLDKVMNLMEIKDENDLYEALKSFVEMMYFRYLAINPKDRKVIICEPLFYSSLFRKTLARVFFQHFDVPALLKVPQNVMALMTLMIPTSLVIDIGYREALCVPVVNGVTLVSSSKFTDLGSKQLHRRIGEELIKYGSTIRTIDGSRIAREADLNERIIEDIKLKVCFVCPFKRSLVLKQSLQMVNDERKYTVTDGCPKDVKYPICGDQILNIPGLVREAACEMFFEDRIYELNLVTLILDTIIECPRDSRKTLISNLVLVGGTSMLPGLKHRLQQELISTVTQSEYYRKKIFCKDFKFHQPPCKENYVCWLGASIFGYTDAMNMYATTRDQYQKLRSDRDRVLERMARMVIDNQKEGEHTVKSEI